jgi:hypothetical protein
MFCAAVPTAMALGAAAHGQQQAAKREAAREGRPAPKPRLSAAKVTPLIVVVLLVASVMYHTQQVV